MIKCLRRIIPFEDHYYTKSFWNTMELNHKEALLREALNEGLLDKPVQISFKKEEYNEEQKIEALDFLQPHYYSSDSKLITTPIQWAIWKYNEVNPYNLILVIEEVDE